MKDLLILLSTLKSNIMDITRLKCWAELNKLGFIRVNFRAHGKIVSIGCALQQKHIDASGKSFYSDLICIEPIVNRFSDGRNYHIYGKVKTPYKDKFYRYEFGAKVEIYRTVETINKFYPPNEILEVVHLILK